MESKIQSQQHYGRLVTLEQVVNPKRLKTWVCRCDCGREAIVLEKNLLSGGSQSCGCSRWTNKEIIKRRLNAVMNQVRELAAVEGVNMHDEKARVEYLLSLLREK